MSFAVLTCSSAADSVVITNSTSEGISGSIYGGNDTINLVNGTYTGVNNTNITIDYDRNITIQSNNSNNKAIIDCDGSWFIYNYGNLTLKNLIIKNAYAEWSGAGAYNAGKLTIINCTFLNNSAEYGGGAIYNNYGEINIYGSVFDNNSAMHGGAIYNYNVPPSRAFSLVTFTGSGSINIFNSTLTNNKALSDGGAIYNNRGSISIQNNNFINNSAPLGGAIFNDRYSNFNVIGSNFINNSATDTDGPGAAIYNNANNNFNVGYSRFVNNTGIAVINNDGFVSADYNWWGDNTPVEGTDYLGLSLSNYFVADLSSKNNTVVNGSNVLLDYSFNLNDNSVANNSLLPYFVANIDGKVVDARFNQSINYLVDSTTVDGIVDNQPLGVAFNLLYPNITTDLTLNKDKVKVNESVTGSVTVTNTGNGTASNLTVVVQLPNNFIVTNPNGATYDKKSHTLTWTINLTPGTEKVLSFTGKFTKKGNYVFSSQTILSNGPEIVNFANIKVVAKAVPSDDPDNDSDNSSGNNAKAVSMKSTGIPILALLLAILIPLIGIRTKKQK
ncbi:MAG: hypothetical protein ACRCVG_03470 [Methanobacteriaceae archaeon]